MNYKYKFKLSELECANCAKKIEVALNKHPKVKKATVNFAKLMITIELEESEEVAKDIVMKIVKVLEPDVKVLDINEKNQSSIKFDLTRLITGIIFFILAIFIKNNLIQNLFIILAYLILLFRVLKKAVIMLVKSFTIDENLLVSISCIGAYLTNNIHEGLMVIILYEIGKILESLAVNNSRKSISDLMDIKPEYANLKKNDRIIKVNPNDVKINDLIIIKKGEKIPLDGIVVEGTSQIDNRALTGESDLAFVSVNDEILSGGINTQNVLTVKVTKTYANSTVANILNLVENATDKKAKTENFVSKAARIYTPIILGLAILLVIFLPLLFHMTLSKAIYRALVFLVVSCPCAIAISVPLSYFSGIGASSKEGILIKGSNFLEASASLKEIIFDKTGTLTSGDKARVELEILDNTYKEEDIKKYIVSGEVLSNHPIGQIIINEYANIKPLKVTNFEEITGEGIKFKCQKLNILVGSNILCGVKTKDNGTFIKINDSVVAKINIMDNIKDNALELIRYLKKNNIKTVMYTGDNRKYALVTQNTLGIDECFYELLPQDKYNLLEKSLKENNGNVAFVGDGINDAPALTLAKVGISMGSIGSDAAISASDIVIINDNLDSIIKLIEISKKTNRIIKQNLIFAIGTKVLVLILSALGIATMWQAVFADTGVTLLAILNTTRILKR